MSELVELRKISLEFRRLSSNFLKTTHDDGKTYVKRLLSYVNDQSVIKKLIDDKISCSDYDCETFFAHTDHIGNRVQIVIPEKEADHIKALYTLLEEISNSDAMLLHFAHNLYSTSSNKLNDIIQGFLKSVFQPLIDYIVDALSMEMMTLEPSSQSTQFNQHIENNYGTANAGESISSTNIINGINSDELLELLKKVSEQAETLIDDEDKISVTESIEVIEQEAASKNPKKSFIKTAIKTLQGIKGTAEFAAATVALVQFIQTFL